MQHRGTQKNGHMRMGSGVADSSIGVVICVGRHRADWPKRGCAREMATAFEAGTAALRRSGFRQADYGWSATELEHEELATP